MVLPKDFVDSIESRFSSSEFDQFANSFSEEVPTSIRVHSEKNIDIPTLEKVKWCDLGYYLDKRPSFTLDPSFHGGAYYVQEASSMSIYHILQQVVKDEYRENIRILDLCAAPGGKSSLIANFLENKGLLVSNEIIKNRAYTLKYNIAKEGFANVIVTNNEPKDFSLLTSFFDLILIDAPCSGEGMFRKDPNAMEEWSLQNVKTCSLRQENIIDLIEPCLKPGGHIIYSTCTFNEHENISQINKAIVKHDFKSIKIDFNIEWNIDKIQDEQAIGYQFYPHKIKGEGFFVSCLQKSEEVEDVSSKLKFVEKNLPLLDKKSIQLLDAWINIEGLSFVTDKTGLVHGIKDNFLNDAILLTSYLRIIYCGISVGIFNKRIFIPDHSLALSLSISKEVNKVDLSHENALLYLKKELYSVDSTYKSWILMQYKGINLGWAKNLGNRINNYFPNEHKIRMSLGRIEQ